MTALVQTFLEGLLLFLASFERYYGRCLREGETAGLVAAADVVAHSVFAFLCAQVLLSSAVACEELALARGRVCGGCARVRVQRLDQRLGLVERRVARRVLVCRDDGRAEDGDGAGAACACVWGAVRDRGCALVGVAVGERRRAAAVQCVALRR